MRTPRGQHRLGHRGRIQRSHVLLADETQAAAPALGDSTSSLDGLRALVYTAAVCQGGWKQDLDAAEVVFTRLLDLLAPE